MKTFHGEYIDNLHRRYGLTLADYQQTNSQKVRDELLPWLNRTYMELEEATSIFNR